jgi:hypothetical protein
MKRLPDRPPLHATPSIASAAETISEIWTAWRGQKLPLYLFLGLCFNLVLAPAVFAATGGDLSRTQAYWLAALGLVTVTLGIYLFGSLF